MQRTFRGVVRFSDSGFTKSRMARRLWVRAERETSGHPGRPISDSIFFVGDILVSVRFPNFYFTASSHVRSNRERTAARKTTGQFARKGPVVQRVDGLKRKKLREGCESAERATVSRVTRVYQNHAPNGWAARDCASVG